jgi:hypothetical protein
MSPEYQGEPVPSMTWPLVMTISYGRLVACAHDRGTTVSRKMLMRTFFFRALLVLLAMVSPFLLLPQQSHLFTFRVGGTPALRDFPLA